MNPYGSLTETKDYALAAFVCLHFLGVSFPYVIGLAALTGVLFDRFWQQVFESCSLGHGTGPKENGL